MWDIVQYIQMAPTRNISIRTRIITDGILIRDQPSSINDKLLLMLWNVKIVSIKSTVNQDAPRMAQDIPKILEYGLSKTWSHPSKPMGQTGLFEIYSRVNDNPIPAREITINEKFQIFLFIIQLLRSQKLKYLQILHPQAS